MDKNTATQLIQAIQKQDLSSVKLLLSQLKSSEQLDSINYQDETGRTPLHYAASGEKRSIVSSLLDVGALIKLDNKGRTPLDLAQMNHYTGHKERVQLLLDENVCIQLVEAAKEGDLDCVKDIVVSYVEKHLRHKDKYINYLDDQACSPLYYAVRNGDKELATYLLDKGAFVSMANKGNRQTLPPLFLAIEKGDEAMVSLLLDKGASVEDTWKENTPIFAAVNQNNASLVQLLLSRGARLSGRSRSSAHLDTLLHRAVRLGHEEIVELLLDKGANVQCKNLAKKTPLFLAIEKENEKVLALVLQKLTKEGVSINEKDIEGQTPLFVAAQRGNASIVSVILNSGADLNIADDRFGMTPVHEAVERENKEVVELLVGKGADVTIENKLGEIPLHSAVLRENEAIVALLLTDDVPINHQDKNGRTPLRNAANKGDASIIRLLLERGANPNIADESSMTPLHGAAWLGRSTAVGLLLERGALIKKDKEGRIPLDLLGSNDHVGVAKLLLQHGAYAYYDQDDRLDRNWENLANADESELPCHTHLILAGAVVPKKVDLPEWLAKRKDLIYTTISNWLAPLQVSDTVSLTQARERAKAEYGPIIPWVLRAFPRLLKWVEAIDKARMLPADKEIAALKARTLSSYAMNALDDLLSAVRVKSEPSQEDTKQSEGALLKALEEGALPKELVLQDKSIAKELVTGLKTHYPTIPLDVAEYLVAEVMNDPKKQCRTFHKQLFDHTWGNSLEPPKTPSMEPHTRRLTP